MLVAVQLSVAGLYLLPVFVFGGVEKLAPPQTIISLPVQTALWPSRAVGAFTIVVGVQLSSPVQSNGAEISGSLYAASGGSVCLLAKAFGAPRAMVAGAESQEFVIASR
jgi:hypothetical protein